VFVAGRYEARIARLGRETAALHERARAETAMVDLMRDSEARLLTLRGPEAWGRVLWSPQGGGVLVATGLPRPPSGKVYAVWLVERDHATAAAILGAGPDGHGLQPLPAGPPTVEEIRVTLEPVTGVPAPRGPVVLTSR
jgi:hypothetical protein